MTDSDSDLLKELLATFQTEAAEHLQLLNQALLKLERDASLTDEASVHSSQELLQSAFRAAHSLKGAARAVSAHEIESLAHSLESVLHGTFDGGSVLSPSVCDVLYETLDAIQALLQGRDVSLDSLQHRLGELSGGDRESGEPEPVVSVTSATPVATSDRAIEVVETPAGLLADDTIRVSINKLDDLMAQVGELLISKISAEQHLADIQNIQHQMVRWPKVWREVQALLLRVNNEIGQQLSVLLTRQNEQLQILTRGISDLNQAVNRDTLRLGLVTNRMQDSVRRLRMVPFQAIVPGLERAVRDVAHGESKEVRLCIEGGEVELDKKVLEMLKDPLLHLLRNAVSHGIECAELRGKLGKPAEGLITLAVQQRGGEVRVSVSDDGYGFDLEGLRRAAEQRGTLERDADVSPNEIIALAFLPGVSTANQVTTLSGRGIGLDIVRRSLEAIQGRVLVDSVPQRGTTFRLMVPTSVTMTHGLMMRIGPETYILPLLAVEKIVELPFDRVFSVEGRPMITVDNRPLVLVSLAKLLGRPESERSESGNLIVVIMSVAEQRLALMVDNVLTEQELAVKPLGRLLRHVRNVTGAALLGNGEPVVILNAAELVKSARGIQTYSLPRSRQPRVEAKPKISVLVVDDSITTRTLEKNILEAAGFEVFTATDGLKALKQMKEHHVEIVVADIQMPEMDGFALTRHLRESTEYAALPIILVTSMGNNEDRERGMLAGANAYIAKRGFDQAELLATIKNLL